MSWGIIAGAVILAVLIIVALYIINRNIEAARARKAQAIAALRKRIGNFRSLLDAVPPHYLGTSIIQYLLGEIALSLQELQTIEPENPRYQDQLEACNAELAQITPQSRPPVYQLKSQQDAIEIRRSLVAASRFLQGLHQAGQLDANRARQLLGHLRLMANQVTIDTFLMKAAESRRENKTEVATLFYQRALEELRKLPAIPYIQQQINQIEKTLQEMGSKPPPSAFDKPKPAAPKETGPSKLEQEMDASANEDEGWKKKYY